MPLKHIDKANPNLKSWWFELMDKGFINLSFDKKAAASVRTQLGRWRTLSAQQAPEFFECIRYIQVTSYPDPNDLNRAIIYGERSRPIDPAIVQRLLQHQQAASSAPPARPLPIPQPAYVPQEHHHNPVALTSTGIPMVMPEEIPHSLPLMTEEERRELERIEERKRNEALIHSLGFDKPVKRNDSI